MTDLFKNHAKLENYTPVTPAISFLLFSSFGDAPFGGTFGQLPGPLCSQRRDQLQDTVRHNHMVSFMLKCISVVDEFPQSIHGIWFCCSTGDFASTWQVEDGQQSLSRERRASI